MNVMKHMNDALTYIEENLENDINMAEAARIACCSEFHFKKMFSYLAGITLIEYVRRRRLTMAGFELKGQHMKVIDAAIKYGYQSPDSFAKAFYQLHGINPSEVNKTGKSLKSFPRMTFQLTISGGSEFIYRIEKKEAFTIVGIKERIPLVYKGENPAITEMLTKITGDVYSKLKSLANVEPLGGYSASFNISERENEEKAELDHLIGVATTKKDLLGLASLDVAASAWAIFTVLGNPTNIQEVWGRIYAEWFPSSNYQVVEGPEILFTDRDTKSPDNKSEIWIPVENK
ncbi:AraC family transcriptional regulator [Paenibacillus nasutitermitis]|uniref:HTH-type transcriptional regulator YdeE n=1 Tax=Paenibacillus nasutitermitis TaxID=1652958 RepID=A0A916Z2G7_9BACL|nr:AraC family transcriptional regulator [Paenibacillus nasutitermitis]GGD72598.1 putative HTH-type transcriptional regulator YdeE [Paenibacillus nasutitermitis]